MDDKNPICLHFDIRQNASRIIESILQKNFQKNYVQINYSKKPNKILVLEEILDLIKNYGLEIKALSSRQIRFPIPETAGLHFISMIFIRNPVERIQAIYNVRRKLNDNSEISIAARTKSFKEFVEWNLSDKNGKQMNNFQTLFLSKNPQKNEEDSDQYKVAIKRLKNSSIMGVVERMDESLTIAEEILKKFFPFINFRYVSQNSDEVLNQQGLSQKMEKYRKELGDKVMEKLLEQNENDLKLYSECNKELDSRISKIVGFEKKLKNFQNRCKKFSEEQIVNKDLEKYFDHLPEPMDVNRFLGDSIPQSIQNLIDILPTIRELIKDWPQSKLLTVLDVGASAGTGSNLLATLYKGKFFQVQMKVDAMDKDDRYKRYADKFLQNINYFVGDIFKQEKNRFWDLIICSHVIEHFENPLSFIAELQKRARHWVLFYTPFEEKVRIRPHKFTYTKKKIEDLNPMIMKIIRSPAWYSKKEDRKCVLFVLRGKGGK